jgi:hypothetical protein
MSSTTCPPRSVSISTSMVAWIPGSHDCTTWELHALKMLSKTVPTPPKHDSHRSLESSGEHVMNDRFSKAGRRASHGQFPSVRVSGSDGFACVTTRNPQTPPFLAWPPGGVCHAIRCVCSIASRWGAHFRERAESTVASLLRDDGVVVVADVGHSLTENPSDSDLWQGPV